MMPRSFSRPLLNHDSHTSVPGVVTGLTGVLSLAIERSSSPMSSPECGNDWKRHITYIIMDFLSGTEVLTSEIKYDIVTLTCSVIKFYDILLWGTK